MSTTLTKDELRELFLFEALDEDQLGWLQKHGEVVTRRAGEVVTQEGDPATCFYVLLSGMLQMTRLVAGDQVEILRADQRGVYFGATQFYLGDQVDQTYSASVRALTSRAKTVAAAGAPPMTDAYDPSTAITSMSSVSVDENTTKAPPW